jgi:hypothetical protein
MLGLFAILVFAAAPLERHNRCADTANEFMAQYNTWAKQVNARRPGTISAAELQQWQRVKSNWRKTERTMDRFYRGEP